MRFIVDLVAGALVALSLLLSHAHAQAPVLPGSLTNPNAGTGQTPSFQPYSSSNPLPVTGSLSATTSATAASTLPTISAGAGAAVYESLGGSLFSQPVFGSASGGGTQVDSTHGLPVQGTGTAGSAAEGVLSVQGVASMTPLLVTESTPADPCFSSAKTNLAISQNGTSSVQLVALSGSTSIYVCSLFMMTNSTATTVALTTGTGTACVTNNAAVIGTTTANIANSANLIAGAGLTYGSGVGTVAKGAASSELCMVLGSNVYVSGNLTYVQQ
jgi:hypothetical protein